MSSYLTKRCLMILPTLLGISIVCFFLIHLTPGGPIERLVSQWNQTNTAVHQDIKITEEQRQAMLQYYGFDKPLFTRYLSWLGKLIRGNLGESYYYEEPVGKVISRRLPVSLSFGILSFILIHLICIPLGILKAIRDGSRFDIISSALIFLLYSIPTFALAIFLVFALCGGSLWNLFPIQGIVSDNFDQLSLFGKILDYVHHIFLPIVCYTVGSLASLTILMKTSLLEQLKQKYMITALAKGLPYKTAVLRHALRNALLPIASGWGQWIGLFFAGSLLIETIFGLEGIGKLSYESIMNRDYPVVLANIMIVSFLHIIGNIISDVLYVILDPRIDFTK